MPSPELFAKGLKNPSGLAFDAEEDLFVTGGQNGCVYKVSADGKTSLFLSVGGQPVGIAFDDSDDMFIADNKRRHLLIVSLEEAVEIYASQCHGRRFNGPHDLYFGPNGTLLFTDTEKGRPDHSGGIIYSVGLDGDVDELVTGLDRPTGLTISEDATTLFVAEAGKNQIRSIPFAEEGTAADQQDIFIRFEDGGDIGSLHFDTEGILYILRQDIGLTMVDPDGKAAGHIPLPGNHPTAMAFGGINFDELFIAEARTDAIYRLPARQPGQRPFAGPRAV